MFSPAIRFIASKGNKTAQGGTIHILCLVKPGVNANRQGITAVSNEAIELCVAAQAREGEANKAVRKVIAETLGIPKSDVDITKGMKNREKTVSISNIVTKNETAEEEIERIRILLQESVSH